MNISLLVCSKMVISYLFATSKVPLLLLMFVHARGSVGHVGYPPPPLWKDVPESLDEFTSQNNKIVINPWNYIERMGMYKVLLNVTAKYMTSLGPNNTGNVLWGLPLQHGWQFHTGINYYLAAIPFLAAIETGLFEDWPVEFEILPPGEMADDFCYTVSGCYSLIPDMMIKWKAFFEYLKRSTSNNQDTENLDQILYYMWIAHRASILAVPKFSERLRYISRPEASFGVNWANTVEFIAATHFHTNYEETSRFQTRLPRRVLVDGDNAPYIADLSAEENHTLVMFYWIQRINTFLGGGLLKLWRRAMCTEPGRAKGRQLLENMTMNPKFVPSGIYYVMVQLSRNQACPHH
ncbi:protein LEG1 homolog isoform X2 [Polyodon spathula]|uniref:protein LEG1 homolog isoform X2 n=1 Tax=Polyodon spathula TaxID=7913 RepID=UPI001B7F1274|nr:protein LEG1 homolog isoform X2 [Polyodon spathula]